MRAGCLVAAAAARGPAALLSGGSTARRRASVAGSRLMTPTVAVPAARLPGRWGWCCALVLTPSLPVGGRSCQSGGTAQGLSQPGAGHPGRRRRPRPVNHPAL